jgi:predicted O-methyltransferase YrrM
VNRPEIHVLQRILHRFGLAPARRRRHGPPRSSPDITPGPDAFANPFEHDELSRNPESVVLPPDFGRVIPPYRPTYSFPGPYINAAHASFASVKTREKILVDIGIPGWLRREDALKLYELAYHSPGNVLELGTFHGLSTTIMAGAIADSGGGREIYSVDLDPDSLDSAEQHLRQRGLLPGVRLFAGDATELCERLIGLGRRFGFVFVDHSHEYQPVLDACRLLDRLVASRALVLFHDLNDPRNNDPGNPDYGVSQAVVDGLPPDRFEPYGMFGCTALFRAKV